MGFQAAESFTRGVLRLLTSYLSACVVVYIAYRLDAYWALIGTTVTSRQIPYVGNIRIDRPPARETVDREANIKCLPRYRIAKQLKLSFPRCTVSSLERGGAMHQITASDRHAAKYCRLWRRRRTSQPLTTRRNSLAAP
jgi:hypothetical protein